MKAFDKATAPLRFFNIDPHVVGAVADSKAAHGWGVIVAKLHRLFFIHRFWAYLGHYLRDFAKLKDYLDLPKGKRPAVLRGLPEIPPSEPVPTTSTSSSSNTVNHAPNPDSLWWMVNSASSCDKDEYDKYQ